MTKKDETNNRAEKAKTEVIEAEPQTPRKTKIKLRQPTLKQKKLIKTLYKNIENGGTYKQALIEAGYSEKTALQAKNIINSPTLQRLMMSAENIGMSDEWFLEKIRTGLEAQDLNAVSKFANLWARLRYSDAFKQKIDYNDNRTVNVYENLSTEELERLAQLDD